MLAGAGAPARSSGSLPVAGTGTTASAAVDEFSAGGPDGDRFVKVVFELAPGGDGWPQAQLPGSVVRPAAW